MQTFDGGGIGARHVDRFERFERFRGTRICRQGPLQQRLRVPVPDLADHPRSPREQGRLRARRHHRKHVADRRRDRRADRLRL